MPEVSFTVKHMSDFIRLNKLHGVSCGIQYVADELCITKDRVIVWFDDYYPVYQFHLLPNGVVQCFNPNGTYKCVKLRSLYALVVKKDGDIIYSESSYSKLKLQRRLRRICRELLRMPSITSD